jgi:hypothetical protein
VKGVEYSGERLLADAHEAQAVPVLAGFVPALGPGDGKGRDPGAVESAGETPSDLAHSYDVNLGDSDFNHLKTG